MLSSWNKVIIIILMQMQQTSKTSATDILREKIIITNK